MKSTASIVRCSIFGAALAAGPIVAGAADDPQKLLRDGTSEVLAIVYDRPPSEQPLSARVRPVLEKYFDFEAITRRAIGPGWRNFTPDQRQRAIALFSDLVIRTYADRFHPTERPKISYAAPVTVVANKQVELPTTIVYAGQKVAVTYRTEQSAAATGWRITDVTIEGVSMISNYRAQFDALYQKGGATAVLRSLEDNLGKLAKS